MMKISIVPPNMVEMVWKDVGPLIQKVIDLVPDNFDTHVQQQYLVNGEKTLLVVTEDEKLIAVITAEITIFETGTKILYVPIVSGSRMKEWMEDVMIVLKNIATLEHCTQIRGQGLSRAWMKKMAKYGLKEISTIYKIDLIQEI